jgi:hypothetical protein
MDFLKFLNNGYDPRLIYGHGGLGYKPKLDIYGNGLTDLVLFEPGSVSENKPFDFQLNLYENDNEDLVTAITNKSFSEDPEFTMELINEWKSRPNRTDHDIENLKLVNTIIETNRKMVNKRNQHMKHTKAQLRESEEENVEHEIVPYRNEVFFKLAEDVNNEIKNKKIDPNNFNSVLGNVIEDFLTKDSTFFDALYEVAENKKTTAKVYNTKNINCPFYTEKIKEYQQKSLQTIETLIKKNPHKKEQILKEILPKLDYMVVDFLSANAVYELKALAYSYETYKKRGYINLVANKILGTAGEFKPIFKEINGSNKFFQITYDIKHFGKKIGSENVLVNNPKGREYIVIFFLSDGIYYYEPLKDEKFSINEHGRGSLDYKPETKTPGGFTCNDYKIPINKLKQMNEEQFNKILYNNI